MRIDRKERPPNDPSVHQTLILLIFASGGCSGVYQQRPDNFWMIWHLRPGIKQEMRRTDGMFNSVRGWICSLWDITRNTSAIENFQGAEMMTHVSFYSCEIRNVRSPNWIRCDLLAVRLDRFVIYERTGVFFGDEVRKSFPRVRCVEIINNNRYTQGNNSSKFPVLFRYSRWSLKLWSNFRLLDPRGYLNY